LRFSRPPNPRFEELVAERDRRFAKQPKTVVVTPKPRKRGTFVQNPPYVPINLGQNVKAMSRAMVAVTSS
jgi:hypothetical protein